MALVAQPGAAADHQPKTLIELATARFGIAEPAGSRQLGPVALKLFTAVADGRLADFAGTAAEQNDLAQSGTWPVDRVLQATWLEWLCTDDEAKSG